MKAYIVDHTGFVSEMKDVFSRVQWGCTGRASRSLLIGAFSADITVNQI